MLNKDMGRLFSYKIASDSGFAPCPFGGFISLATCKPKIRQYKNIGDWIAGFTSIQLDKKYRNNIQMIYLMKIEKKVSFKDYWNDNEYSIKKPNNNSDTCIKKIGDNYYKPIMLNHASYLDYEIMPNLHHNSSNKEKDTSGIYVLISKEFYYFGKSPISIPQSIHPDVPKAQSAHGSETKDENRKQSFLDFIKGNYKIGIYNQPHRWEKMFGNDDSWRSDENYIKS